MPRLRGFWETADFWSPEARSECGHTGLQDCMFSGLPPSGWLWLAVLQKNPLPEAPPRATPGLLQLCDLRKSGVAKRAATLKSRWLEEGTDFSYGWFSII